MTDARPSSRQLLMDRKREKLSEEVHVRLTYRELLWLKEIKAAGKFQSISDLVRSILVAVRNDDEDAGR